jgi:hypothetical protein
LVVERIYKRPIGGAGSLSGQHVEIDELKHHEKWACYSISGVGLLAVLGLSFGDLFISSAAWLN